MDQYRPLYQVGAPPSKDKYSEIDRRPLRQELIGTFHAARKAGLSRFDERR